MPLEGPQLDFELLFHSSPSLFLVLDPAPGFTVLAASDAYLRATRTDREAIVGRGLLEAFPAEGAGEAAASLRASLQRVLTTRAPELTTIARYDLRPAEWSGADGGQQRFWRALNSPVLSPDGRLRYIIHRVEDAPPPPSEARPEAPAFDVHPRRNKVELLRIARDRDEALRELKAAHEELEAFDYALAHALRSPLKSIEGFCMVLLERHADGLDSKGRKLLGSIESDAQRMAATLDGLLVLSQIGKSKLSRQRVDLTALARRVVEELKRRKPQRMTVDIAEGLEAYADPRLVEVALEQLIANAWKFSSRTHDAHIEIGQHVFAGEKVFCVKDNGAGFDMIHTGRLFTPFVRLHGAEFEGNGIGLATVKRIMDRHEGRVWAEAQRDRGAVVSFTFGA